MRHRRSGAPNVERDRRLHDGEAVHPLRGRIDLPIKLHLKRQREGLTATEAAEAAGLTRQYERVMLVRARAAALLRERGHDVTSPVAPAMPPQ